MYRGSRKHILDWTEHPRFVPEFLRLLAPVAVKVTAESAWAPRGYRFPDEARLEGWGPRHWGSTDTWKELERWWLAAPRGANTPNWDLALVAEIEGQKGLVLVEAKANVPELGDAGKGDPGDSDGSRANHQRIGEAIESARIALLAVAPDLMIGRDNHYQLANRLAFTWKIASLGIPVVLLYLGFTGDDGIRDAGEPLSDSEHWLKVMNGHLEQVGGKELTERRHQLGAAPFWVLVRSRPVLEVSERVAP